MSAAGGTPSAPAYRVRPGGALRGRLRVPGDKSISHRALLLGAIAEGTTRISGFLEAADTLATLAAIERLGVTVRRPGPGRVEVEGAGLHGLRAPEAALDLGNAGTAMRLLAGLLAGQPFAAELTGDASLRRRPMRRITEPLARMGAAVGTGDGGTPPLVFPGRPRGAPLDAIDWTLPVASAQAKSCVLLAGLYARGRTCVREPAASRDHTERMLAGFGAPPARDGTRTCVEGGARLAGCEVEVPADFSSAAFFLVGASIAPGSDLVLEGVGVNPTRTAAIAILREMGARIDVLDEHAAAGEPRADLRVRAAPLAGIRIPEALVPGAIDEFPALLVAAACARGETVLSGAAELRVKESDRIAAMAAGLSALGAEVEPTGDGMVVRGRAPGEAFAGGRVDSAGDHRVAMALAMAGLAARAPVLVSDCANVDTSFPGFPGLARRAGLGLDPVPAQAGARASGAAR